MIYAAILAAFAALFASPAVAAFISFVIGLLVVRIVAAVGLGIVTHAGITNVFQTIQDSFFSAYDSLPAVTLALFERSGITFYFELIFSTMAGILTYRFLTKSFKRLSVGHS